MQSWTVEVEGELDFGPFTRTTSFAIVLCPFIAHAQFSYDFLLSSSFFVRDTPPQSGLSHLTPSADHHNVSSQVPHHLPLAVQLSQR